jgi:S1-C subfamily serine protease
MIYKRAEPEHVFLGSCFALRDSTTVLTAAHCIGDLDADELYVKLPGILVVPGIGQEAEHVDGVLVREVVRHPDADVALLRLRVVEWVVEPFWRQLPIHGLGEDVMAYGYPENVRSGDRSPTARLFKGYVQRVYRHDSHMGFRYTALELDFACPAGLSGGPVFRPGAPQMVLGLATENFESTTYLDAVEETSEDGATTRRTQYQRVLSYGVAVSLESLEDWLDDHLPEFDSGAYRERRESRP